MGRDSFHPRRGSLGYYPRARASRWVPRIKSWLQEDVVRIQGFAGYKAGMTHGIFIDNYKNSPTYGEEIMIPLTIIDTPPLRVFGIRVYIRENGFLRTLTEVYAKDLDKDLARVFTLPKNLDEKVIEKRLEDIYSKLDEIEQIRVLVSTQPRLTSLGKKKPDVMEYLVSGKKEDAFNYAKSVLGKEIRVKDVFNVGDYVDVIAVTKGKGFQSVVKRFGVKLLPHKARKGRRKIGTMGPEEPHCVLWTVPRHGQMGFHKRTEYNKRIMFIGENGFTVKGGIPHYGVIKGDYILLAGSVPGAVKRLIRIRPAIRKPKVIPDMPKLVYISQESKQGV